MAGFGALLNLVLLRPLAGQEHLRHDHGDARPVDPAARRRPASSGARKRCDFDSPFSRKVVHLGGVVLSQEHVAIILTTVLLVAALFAFFRFSRIGIAMQASSENPLAAYYMGIPVKSIHTLTWALGAAIAAIAGIMLAPVAFVHVNMGFLGLKAFPAAVLGGFGSIPGAIVGGIIIGVVDYPWRCSICRRVSTTSPPIFCCCSS